RSSTWFTRSPARASPPVRWRADASCHTLAREAHAWGGGMGSRIMLAVAAALGLAVSAPVSAEDADWYRGGWRTDAGEPHVYQFVIRGDRVTGYYCTQCADGTTLAPIEGTFDEREGVSFTIRHLDAGGSTAARTEARGRLADG